MNSCLNAPHRKAFLHVLLISSVLFVQPLTARETSGALADLIDGFGNLQQPGAVLVAGDRIVAVGQNVTGQAHEKRVNLGDATLLPGLIDLHTHLTDAEDAYWERVLVTTTPSEAALYGAANALTALRSGFTTVRDMGPAWSFTDVDLRNIIDEGTLPGPRMMVAGNYVSATGGAGDARQFSIYVDVPAVRNLADGVDEVRRAVRTNLKQGADFIKILATGAVLSRGISPGAQQYSDEELGVAVVEAGRWDRFVAAHAHGTEGIKAAIRAGVRTVDHGSMMDDEAIQMLLAQNYTYYVPTLYVGVIVPRKRSHGDSSRAGPEIHRDDALPERNVSQSPRGGLPIGFGTDAGAFPRPERA